MTSIKGIIISPVSGQLHCYLVGISISMICDRISSLSVSFYSFSMNRVKGSSDQSVNGVLIFTKSTAGLTVFGSGGVITGLV